MRATTIDGTLSNFRHLRLDFHAISKCFERGLAGRLW
jgi:hypothetical protein